MFLKVGEWFPLLRPHSPDSAGHATKLSSYWSEAMHESEFMGVRFIEGQPYNCKVLEPISIELSGVLTSSQLKSLDDVKRIMAERARSKGGNSIVNFKYGQRAVGCLASLFMRDDVSWYGSGRIAQINASTRPSRR
jgi:hypothetical protein